MRRAWWLLGIVGCSTSNPAPEPDPLPEAPDGLTWYADIEPIVYGNDRRHNAMVNAAAVMTATLPTDQTFASTSCRKPRIAMSPPASACIDVI